ncbi:hypothetical protein FQN57_003817 [Myotisia sp. PD_48]|nr:hypothetical protein FQN57_003817 [Myotisia sp. PD_48]
MTRRIFTWKVHIANGTKGLKVPYIPFRLALSPQKIKCTNPYRRLASTQVTFQLLTVGYTSIGQARGYYLGYVLILDPEEALAIITNLFSQAHMAILNQVPRATAPEAAGSTLLWRSPRGPGHDDSAQSLPYAQFRYNQIQLYLALSLTNRTFRALHFIVVF